MRLAIYAAGLVLGGSIGSAAVPASDPYEPLGVYAGHWKVVVGGQAAVSLVNTCARTGLFFLCEQATDGSPKNLVVFLPRLANDGRGRYRTAVVRADGGGPGPWSSLTITGANWVYTGDEAAPSERTLNRVVDADHIHFDVQKRSGDAWTTTLSGDETRVK